MNISISNPILESIRVNYIFYTSCILCIWLLTRYTKSSIITTSITLIVISLLGYISHAICHVVNLRDGFNRIDSHLNNVFTRSSWGSYIINNTLQFYEFHETIHHDTNINKQWANVLFEFIGNFWFQAGTTLALRYILNLMDVYAIVLWGVLYATVHNINYVISPSHVHIKHHLDKFTNYGIDIWDMVFNTKYNGDYSEIENINHYSINLIICTMAICMWITRYNTG